MFTTESARMTSRVFIEPDKWLWEPDWKIYYYYWLGIPPYWKWTNEYIREKLLMLPEKERRHERAYGKIFDQATAFCHYDGYNNEIIKDIKKGLPKRYEIQYRSIKSWYDPEIRVDNLLGIRAKYYWVSLCPLCKKSVNITLSHPKKYCPNCERLTSNQKLQLRRAIKKGKRTCKYCGVVILEDNYPNREYCCRAHNDRAYRRKKEHDSELKDMENFYENNIVAG